MSFELRQAEVLQDGRLVRLLFTSGVACSEVGPPDWRPGWLEGLRIQVDGVAAEPLGVMKTDWTLPADQCWTNEREGANLNGRYVARVAYVNDRGEEVELSASYAEFKSHEHWSELKPGTSLVLRLPHPVPTGQTARVYLSGPDGDGTRCRRVVDGIPPGAETCEVRAQPAPSAPAPAPLTSWVLHVLMPEGRPIARGRSVTVDVPSGILRDSKNEQTKAARVQALNDSWVGEDGFSAELVSTASTVLHVSSSRGLDTNPGTADRPLKTVARAWRLIKPGAGGTIRLRRGDVFAEPNWRPQPATDARALLVIEDYWHPMGPGGDPGTRPIVQATDRPSINWHPGHARHLGNYLIRRLHFQGGRVSINTAFDNLIFDDCTFERAFLSVQARGERAIQNVALLRCTLIDANSPGAHVQGFFCHNTRRVLISQCMVDRCGYPSLDFSRRDIYCHNIYLQNSVGEAAVWGSWILRGGSHGVQLRSHGLIARNVLGLNALGAFIKSGGTQAMNVYIASDDIAPNTPRGTGAGMQASPVPSYSQRVEGCLFLHARGGQPRSVILGKAEGDLPDRKHFEEVRYNLVLEHGAALWINQTALLSTLNGNVLVLSEKYPLFVVEGQVDLSRLRSDANVILAAPNARIARANGLLGRDQWVKQGQDQHSTFLAPRLPQVRYGLGDYAKAAGVGATEAALLAALRQRPPRQWPSWHVTEAAYSAFLEAYRLREPLPIAAGPWYLRDVRPAAT